MNQPYHHAGFRWTALLFLLIAPGTAQAHGSMANVTEFVNGLTHPLFTPAHLLIILALGLLTGQRTPLRLKLPLLIFLPVSAAALLFTVTGLVMAVYQPILIGIALTAAILVTLEKSPSPLMEAVVFAAAAIGLGLDSEAGVGMQLTVLKTLLGTWLSLSLAIFFMAYYIALFNRKPWIKIGIRVLGSWIIAIALLMLAFALKSKPTPILPT